MDSWNGIDVVAGVEASMGGKEVVVDSRGGKSKNGSTFGASVVNESVIIAIVVGAPVVVVVVVVVEVVVVENVVEVIIGYTASPKEDSPQMRLG